MTGYVSIYDDHVLPSLGSAFHDTITGCCTVYGNAALATLDTAFSNLVTVTGYLSISTTTMSWPRSARHFQAWLRSPECTSVANNPSFALCNGRWFSGCGANWLGPRTGSADKLAVNVSVDIHTNLHSTTMSPTQAPTPDPDHQPDPEPDRKPDHCRPRSRPQPRPRPRPRRR